MIIQENKRNLSDIDYCGVHKYITKEESSTALKKKSVKSIGAMALLEEKKDGFLGKKIDVFV